MIKVIALCGEAGSGKDYVLARLLEEYPNNLQRIISHTSRAPREGEEDGVDYHFRSNKEMFIKVYRDDFIECDFFFDELYGVSKNALSREKINIGDFSPEGILNLLEHSEIEVMPIYIEANDHVRFKRMMKREPNKSIDELYDRFQHDQKVFASILFLEETYYFNNEMDTVVKKDLEKLKLDIETHFSEKI